MKVKKFSRVSAKALSLVGVKRMHLVSLESCLNLEGLD